jgi:peptide deformylase
MSKPLIKLQYYPYPSLRQKAIVLQDFSLAPMYFHEMIQIMYTHDGCGLAANQVGLLSRVFVMDISADRSSPIFIANPEIIEFSSQTHQMEEGCLSLPGISHMVTRPRVVSLRYYDENSQPQEREFSDLASSCVQHEIDHLDGKLFPDRTASHESAKLWKKYKIPRA